MAKGTNPDFLNGVPELLVLKLLKQKPCYGYELGERLRGLTGDAFEFHDGSIYPVLHRLEGKGLLRSRKEIVESRVRRIYEVTEAGEKHFETMEKTWTRIARVIGEILREGRDDHRFATE